ncbi:hypothetical protein C5167_029501 [Papaver somniferum]|nr:hypothetical protein C5167_029501 [Papaver somniferum]
MHHHWLTMQRPWNLSFFLDMLYLDRPIYVYLFKKHSESKTFKDGNQRLSKSSLKHSSKADSLQQSCYCSSCAWVFHNNSLVGRLHFLLVIGQYSEYKYYFYNSVTSVSQWETPEELTLFEQHQQQK